MPRALFAVLLLAGCSVHTPRTDSPLHVAMKTPTLELCEGMHGYLITVTSWTYTTETPPEGPPEISWRTLAPSVAEVDGDGQVSAVSPGKAIIEATVRLGGKTGTAKAEVTVKPGSLDTSAAGEADTVVCR